MSHQKNILSFSHEILDICGRQKWQRDITLS
nr:MAG TPA: hypothetical protein [Caudoviricetes sp.]